MNKEVIYLEPDDDITDILTKLQQAKEKLVALVPPKKATILRSAVNMKLVAKAAKEGEKVAVVVTSDPAILKLAMAAKIPVAKNLQSRPVVPTEESLRESEAAEQVIDENNDSTSSQSAKNAKKSDNDEKNRAKTSPETSKSASQGTSGKSGDNLEFTDETLEKGSKDAKNGGKKGQKGAKNKKVPNFAKQRKKIIIGAVAGVLLIVFVVWALVFAPATDIVVAINTISNNFSESVNFTTNMADENIDEGKLYAEKITYEEKQEVNFSATGQEDRGEKARGEVTISKSFKPDDYLGKEVAGISVNEGDQFISGGKTYVATSGGAAPGWNGEPPLTCSGKTYSSNKEISKAKPCELSVTVNIQASNPGAEFNLDAGSSWGSFEGNTVVNTGSISGGSTKIVSIVTHSDVDKAKNEINERESADGKEMLYKDIKDTMLPIEASYQSETPDATSSPAIGEEVSDGTKPTVTATKKYSIYVVDKTKIEEYIKKKSNLADDQRIYSYGEPYFEHFENIDQPARLKAITESGPTVTEEEIFDRSKGQKIGQVQSDLKRITGVSTVDIRTSFFWVTSIPNDRNKVHVELTVEEGK